MTSRLPPLRPPLLPLALAVVLALAATRHWPMWGDELWTRSLLELSAEDMLAKVARDFHPPGYFSLVWGLFDLSSPAWLIRLPSAIGAIVTAALVGALGRRWFDEITGSVATYALALSPFLMTYAGVARGYALLAGITALLLLAAVELVSGERVRRAAIVLGIAGTAAIYVHYAAAAALVSAAVGIGAGLYARPDRGRGRWSWAAGAFAAMALLFVPWALGPMEQQNLHGVAGSYSPRVLLFLGWPIGPYQPVVNCFLLVPAAVGVVVLAWRRRPADRVLLAWAVCGIVVPLALSARGDIQWKFYVQSWFLPAWALLVGVGATPVLARLSRRPSIGSVVGGLALAAACVGPLHFLWTLPSGPFGLRKSNTAYDPRKDIAVFAAALPAGTLAGDRRGGGPMYELYGGEVVGAASTMGWRFASRDDLAAWSLTDDLAQPPCVFAYAFFERVGVPDPAQCAAVLRGIEAGARDGYPPFMLELANQARSENRYVEAEALARDAARAGLAVGWTGPAAYLAQFHAQNQGYEAALAAADEGLAVAVTWGNRNAALELYGMRGGILAALGRDREAQIAARCAQGESLALPCPYAGE